MLTLFLLSAFDIKHIPFGWKRKGKSKKPPYIPFNDSYEIIFTLFPLTRLLYESQQEQKGIHFYYNILNNFKA